MDYVFIPSICLYCSCCNELNIGIPVGANALFHSLLCSFIVAIAAYFIGGAIFMRVKYQATGTDLIPNKNIWFEIPSLIKVCMCYLVIRVEPYYANFSPYYSIPVE